MLQVQFIKENKETVLAGLKKRNFPEAEQIIELVLTTEDICTQSILRY